MKRILGAALLVLALTAAGCASVNSKPMLKIENVSTPAGTTTQKLEEAMDLAMRFRGWQTVSRQPGKWVAQINVRDKHSAKVEIDYTASAYTIRYLESTGLDHDPATGGIHHNYNRWVNNLSHTIQQMLNGGPPPAP